MIRLLVFGKFVEDKLFDLRIAEEAAFKTGVKESDILDSTLQNQRQVRRTGLNNEAWDHDFATAIEGAAFESQPKGAHARRNSSTTEVACRESRSFDEGAIRFNVPALKFVYNARNASRTPSAFSWSTRSSSPRSAKSAAIPRAGLSASTGLAQTR